MAYKQKYFHDNNLTIKDRYFKYFLSPILVKNNFKHGFVHKERSGDWSVELLRLPCFNPISRIVWLSDLLCIDHQASRLI